MSETLKTAYIGEIVHCVIENEDDSITCAAAIVTGMHTTYTKYSLSLSIIAEGYPALRPCDRVPYSVIGALRTWHRANECPTEKETKENV